MPTRRAFRPDGSYYRTTRRQRLTRTPDGKLRVNPVHLIAVVFGLIAGWGFYMRFASHAGWWSAVLAWVAVVLCVASVALASVIRMR